jgi:hypothetical protein
MELTKALTGDRRAHVEARLQTNLMAWLTTVNANVALGLDVTDLGRDIIRIEGSAAHVVGHPSADQVPAYVAKYTERIGAIFGTAEAFARSFTEAIVITPRRLHA